MVDVKGIPIQRVEAFDTDTFLCRIHGGKREVAAAFVLPCHSKEHLERMISRLPDSMQQFICYEPDSEKAEAACQDFVNKQLERRKFLRDVSNEHHDEKDE